MKVFVLGTGGWGIALAKMCIRDSTEVEPLGVFYGGGFHFFGIQVLGVVAVIAWVAITMTCLLYTSPSPVL